MIHALLYSARPLHHQAMDERTLAKESQIRLNDFVGRLKAMPTCDLSAQVAIQGAIHAALHITQTAPCGYKDPTPPGAEKLSKVPLA